MSKDQHIHGLCEEKARAGDGAFAIAFALLNLTDAQKQTADALDRLGLNCNQASGPPGTTEAIAMELKRMADAMEESRV